LGWSGVEHPVAAADLYQGQVVDDATGQPLLGAVVSVIWFRTPIVQMEGSRYFQSAQETVTDSQGKFSLIASPGIDWSPLTTVIKEPTVVIYQPEYEPVWATWMVRMGFKSSGDFAAALKKGLVIKLSKLKTKEQLRYFSDVGSVVHPSVPNEQIPKLVEAFNIQRKNLGFKPIPLRN
jgi:hypothetical protein